MKNSALRRIWAKSVSILLCFLFIISGYNFVIFVDSPNSSSNGHEAHSSTGPLKVDLSFPTGAPKLNQTAGLRCTITANEISENVSVTFDLSEGFKYVGGESSWKGNLYPVGWKGLNQSTKEINLTIKAVKSGDWTINAVVNAGGNNWQTPEEGAKCAIYVSMSDVSAKVQSYPFWVDKPYFGADNLTQQQKLALDKSYTRILNPPPVIPEMSVKQSSSGSLTIKQAGSVGTVYGRFKFFTDESSDDYRDAPDDPINANQFYVELLRADTQDHLAWGATDSAGNYSIDNVDISYGVEVMLYCWIIYAPDNYELKALDPNGDVWRFCFGPYYGTFDLSEITIDSDDGPVQACWLKDDLDRTYKYVPDGPCSGAILWPASDDNLSHYHAGGQIHIVSGDEKSKDIPVHEYGHDIMYRVYGNYSIPNSYYHDHTMGGAYSQECAWSEGWANFLALAVNSNSGITFGNGFVENLETPTWNKPGWHDGDKVEGRVSGALWDILDTNPDSYDSYSFYFTDIWDTFTNQQGDSRNTFVGFYQTWALDQTGFRYSAYQNTIFGLDNVYLYLAVDNNILDWETGGDAVWSEEKIISNYGGDAAQSGDINNSQNTWIKASNINGPGVLQFWWRVSSESGHDYLHFYLDNNQQPERTIYYEYEETWSFNIPQGNHYVTWKYIKDSSSTSSSWDCGWLDKVEWIPNSLPVLSSGGVTPSSGYTNTTFTYFVNYADVDSDNPVVQSIYIDGTPHNMTLYSGTYSNGTYYYSTTLSAGSHIYYFLFDDGMAGSVRLPVSGTYSGPTVNQIQSPTVTNSNGATSITSNSARLNGEVTSTGGENPTVTIYWGDNDGGTVQGNWDHPVSLGVKGLGTFYLDISGLSPGTTYYYRCYASNSGGTDWANSTATFVTIPADKIGVYGPSTGSWMLDLNGNGTWDGTGVGADKLYYYGSAGDITVTGDWDEDGITEIGVYTPSIGTWIIDYNGNGIWDGTGVGGDKLFIFGASYDIPVTGDWDGDGTTEIGLYRSSIGTWILDYNGNGIWDGTGGGDILFTFGISTDIPVTGNWNGDSITEIGIYRPSSGAWALDFNGNGQWDGTGVGADILYFFGISTDIPVTGNW